MDTNELAKFTITGLEETETGWRLHGEFNHLEGVHKGGGWLFVPWTDAAWEGHEVLGEELETLDRATFADLAQVRHHRNVVVLDVRRHAEWQEGHIDGAVNIPLHELLGRVAEVPAGEVWVHCAGGYRASIAASILATQGNRVVAVDDSFEEQTKLVGLPLVTADESSAA